MHSIYCFSFYKNINCLQTCATAFQAHKLDSRQSELLFVAKVVLTEGGRRALAGVATFLLLGAKARLAQDYGMLGLIFLMNDPLQQP
jgi:hypothetical protein